MTRLMNGLMQRFAGAVSIAAIASLTALPSVAQTTRPNEERIPAPVDRTADDDTRIPTRTDIPRTEGDVTPRPGDSRSPASGDRMSPRDGMSSVSTLDQEFFRLAYQGNNAEIQTSQLALQRSQDPEIREYAQRMISEHTRANEELTRLANQQNLELPSERVDPLNRALAERLSQLSGAEFNQAYMTAQANAHLRTIALYRTELAQGQEDGLRTYASRVLPQVEQHYEMASEMLPNYAADNLRPNVDVRPVQ